MFIFRKENLNQVVYASKAILYCNVTQYKPNTVFETIGFGNMVSIANSSFNLKIFFDIEVTFNCPKTRIKTKY